MSTQKLFICVFFGFVTILFSSNPVFSTDIEVAANPKGIAINPITGVAVIANEKADSVSGVDIDTQTVIFTIAVGKSPKGVAIDNELNIAVVSNSNENTVSVIDLEKYQVAGTVTVGKDPEGITVDQSSHKALVTNHKDGTVSVIDLFSLSVLSTISVGQEPVDVAVDPGLNLALVVNEKDNNLSLLKSNNETGVFQVGQRPRAISINPETHAAVVADEKENAVSAIDLNTWKTNNVVLGKHPLAVAINSLDNRSLAVCDEDREAILVDSDSNSVVWTYPLDKLPRGVAIDNFRNIAAVTGDKKDSLTMIRLPNPVPEIVTIAPDSALRGSDGIDLAISGSKFIKTSQLSMALSSGGQELDAVFIDNHNIGAAISKTVLSKAGYFPVTVSNPEPAGGRSNGIYFTVNNPVPSITILEPADAIAGSSALTLNIGGGGFFDDTEITFGGIAKTPRYVDTTKLQIDLTAEDVKTTGKYEVTASNSSPGGGKSNTKIFTVKNPLEIKITYPSSGETINRSKTIIKGTCKSDSIDIGIIVNGILAEINGNEWVANDVPLSIGENKIMAYVKDANGNTADSSITINTSDTTQKVRLSANIASGIQPLFVGFSVTTAIPNSIVSFQMDFEGNGTIDYSDPSFEEMTYTYTNPGIYYPTVTVVDDQGNRYTDTIAITVQSKSEVESLLKTKWDGTKTLLKNGDIEGALGFFIESSKERYKGVFVALKDKMPDILATFIEFNIVDVYENIAEYEMVTNENGTLYSYPGVCVKDRSGIWKFKDF